MSYLLDSNTIIYASKSDGSAIRDWINKHHTEVYVAEISLAEVRNWPKLAKTEIRQQALLIEALLDSFTVLKLDPVGVVISDLLRTKVNLKNADAIIAATALRYDLYLVTANTKDFEKHSLRDLFPRLKIISYKYEDRLNFFSELG